MNIILTSDYSPWCRYTGGAQRSVHNLATHLVRLGVKTSVVYSKSPFEKVTISDPVNYDIKWASMPSLRTKRSAILRNWSAIGIAKSVKELWAKDTIVHANGEEAALVSFLRPDLPFGYVATPRYPAFPSVPIVHHQKRPDLFQLTTYGKYKLLPYVVHHADQVIVASQYAANMIQQTYAVEQSKIGVIPNGISETAFEGPSRKPKPNSILFFGRLEKPKGIELLLQSFLSLPSEASLTIVGDGTLKVDIIQFICRHKLEQRVTLKSWMEPQQLVAEIARSMVVCLPSIEESFGNAMAEAMAIGTPIVSTDCCSIPELIIHEKTGRLSTPGSVDSITNNLLEVFRNPSKAEKMAKLAQAKSKDYRWSKIAGDWIAAYENLCRKQ